MTNEEAFLRAMKELTEAQENDDTENAHQKADLALCEFLQHLGWAAIVDEWNKVGKWHA
jgi:hypothetical protein